MKKLPLSGFARKVSGIQKTLVFSKNDDIIRGNKEVSVLAKKKNTTIKEKPTYEELEETIKELKEKLKGKENPEYKSRLFSFIFGRAENKEWTLSLYNAIRGTSHGNPDDITINTIEDVVYLGMKNDLSILVSEAVNLYKSVELYEQQSTLNPNMPVREFMYAGKIYDKFLYEFKFNRYGTRLIPLPIPKLVVFYNGLDDQKDDVMLRLSDAFKQEIRNSLNARKKKLTEDELDAEVERIYRQADPDIQVKVRMVNINYGHSKGILDSCRPLREYAWLVAEIRRNNEPDADGNRPGIEAAIDKSLDNMPDDFVIKNFIMANRAEVKDMCLTEYNEAEIHEMFKQEGWEIGRDNAFVQCLENVMNSLSVSIEQAMDVLKVPMEQRGTYRGLVHQQSSKLTV